MGTIRGVGAISVLGSERSLGASGRSHRMEQADCWPGSDRPSKGAPAGRVVMDSSAPLDRFAANGNDQPRPCAIDCPAVTYPWTAKARFASVPVMTLARSY